MIKLISVAVFGLGFAVNVAAADLPEPNATLTKIEGKQNVMVNTGAEFAPASVGMRLKPGDRVMVGDDSEADVKFDDECPYEMDENKIYTVPDRSTCAGGAFAQQSLNPEGGEAIGSGTGNGGVGIMAAIVLGIDAWAIAEGDDETTSP